MSDEKKTISLDELKDENVEENTGGIKEVSTSDIKPFTEAEPVETAQSALFKELENATERVKDDIDLLKDEYHAKVDSGDIEIDDEEEATSKDEVVDTLEGSNFTPKKKIVIESNEEVEDKNEEEVTDTLKNVNPVLFEDMDDDEFFKDLDGEYADNDDDSAEDEEEEKELTEEEQKKQVEKLKDAINKEVTPIKKSFDLSKFTIRKKPISISKLINMEQEKANVADWVYYSAKRPFSMREFKGAEIDALNITGNERNRLNKLKEIYGSFYDHIVDANKPKSFEEWLKTVSFFELNHIWFCAYKASFTGANAIPYSCPKCKEMFIKEKDFDDMVKYSDDSVKEEVARILEKDTTTPNEELEYEVQLKQVSDEYVFALKEPTLWSVIFETAALSDDFTQKYQDVLGLMAYIDDIYYIDSDNNELIPINTNPDKNNTVKTAMRKISAYYKILSSLSSDQYYNLTSFIQNINEKDNNISYVIPEEKCPECGTKIPEEIRTPEQLLFTRHQLRAIANISTK